MGRNTASDLHIDERPPRRAASWGALVAVAAAPGLGAVEVLLTHHDGIGLGLLATVPFLAATLSTIAWTVAAGAAAFGVAVATAGYEHLWWTRDVRVVLVGIAVATVAAAVTAALRGRRLRQLHHTRHVADVVQQTLLHPIPPAVDDVAAAAHYSSATSGAHVGGDIYDLQRTPYGVRVIIGDVRGKGLPAVRLASVALTAFREWSHHEPALTDVASRIDASVARHADPEEFVTAALVELGRSTVDVVNCAHQPPLLLGDGTVTALEPAEPSLPLGLGATPARQRLAFGPGARLLLYTDGVTEARRRNRTFDLAAELGHCDHASPQQTVHQLYRRLRRFAGHRLADDVAILLLERTADGPGEPQALSPATCVEDAPAPRRDTSAAIAPR